MDEREIDTPARTFYALLTHREHINRLRVRFGCLLILIAFVLAGFAMWVDHISLAARISLIILFNVLLGVGVYLLIYKPLPDLPLETDPRQPFLFSRSFGDKRLVFGPPRQGEGPVVYSGRSLIEDIDSHLGKLGRSLLIQDEPIADFSKYDFVAIKDDDKRWRDTFLYLATFSRAILVIPAATCGVREELRMLASHKHLEKTLVFMPPVSPSLIERGYEVNRFAPAWRDIQEKLRAVMGLNLPDYKTEGLVYVPNPDFSVNRSYPLRGAESGIAEAVRELLLADDSRCLPLSKIVSHLKQAGFVQTSRRLFERGCEGVGRVSQSNMA